LGLLPTHVVHITYVVRLLTAPTGFWVPPRPIFHGYDRAWSVSDVKSRVSAVTVEIGLRVSGVRIEADQRRNGLERIQNVHPVVRWSRG
jgi:hypothetical protein